MIKENDNNVNKNADRAMPSLRDLGKIAPTKNTDNNSILLMLLIILLASKRPFC